MIFTLGSFHYSLDRVRVRNEHLQFIFKPADGSREIVVDAVTLEEGLARLRQIHLRNVVEL